VVEDILGDLSLLRCGSSSKLIEITIEPLVDLSVQSMVVVADLLGSLAFLAGLGFGGRTILVSSTDVDCVVAGEAAVSGVDVSGQDAANDVAEMRHVVHVRQCTGDQNVSLSGLWQDSSSIGASDLSIGCADCRAFALDDSTSGSRLAKGIEVDKAILGADSFQRGLDLLVDQLGGRLKV